MNKVNQPTRFFAINKKYTLRSTLVFVPGDYYLTYNQENAVDEWAHSTFFDYGTYVLY